MFGCANSLSMIEQSFECIAVLHFQAIYEENSGKNYWNEIIEFSIVSANVKRQSIVNNLSKHYYRKLNYNERECFVYTWRTESGRDLNSSLLERRHWGTFIWMKSAWPTNGPIEYILMRDFERRFLDSYSIELRLVETPLNRESFYLSKKILLKVPSRSVQEQSSFQKDQKLA